MARYRKANVFRNNIKKILTVVMIALGIAAVAWFFLGKSGAGVRNADNTPDLSVEEQKGDSDVSVGRESNEVEIERWLGIAASVIGIVVGLIEIIKYITGHRSPRS